MLHEILSQFFEDIEDSIRKLESANVERYEEEVLTSSRANLRIRVRFLRGHLLEVNEAIVVVEEQIKHLGYRCHFQDQESNLIFRYDTPHFPDLKSFPHHKHLKNNVEDSDQPFILNVIEEAKLLAKCQRRPKFRIKKQRKFVLKSPQRPAMKCS